MSFDYDLFVIGGGSGGVRAARIAAGHGARVAVAEEYRVGGTCVIRGCVPKKLMVYAARFADDFADAAGFGWTVGPAAFDWPTFLAAKDREIDRLEAAYGTNLDRSGVEVLRTRAEIVGEHQIRLLADGRTVTAAHVLVATGATPVRDAGFEGEALAVTSEEVMNWPERPQRLLVLGGGYIAVEFASLFNGLGTQTTLLYRGEEILRGFDLEVRRHLHGELSARGLEVITGDVVARLERTPEGLRATTRGGRVSTHDAVVLAIGRRPSTAGLGLDRVGLALAPNGAVPVTGTAATALPWLHAVGDVTDRVALTPVAIREGHAFADTLFGGRTVEVSHDLIPTAVFSTPEVGTVGAGEEDLQAIGRGYDVYRATFRPMRAVLAGREGRTLMKILVDAADDRVLGVHIVGPDAAEMIQVVAIAVRMGARKADFDATMALHPSAAEELVTMRSPTGHWRPATDPIATGSGTAPI
ncbi:glutathione-disulfide reductase [Siculibacillus lacustris]|uniref:Glutathione-disulfide reductase n=1 Tax=Siculibacillus lacustris TaxID=1549641 RepID=A0A4Q9VY55_9HYPH|nr:glutathione-disulfide reductase [Siculibacillus lacustris]TBW40902.1 glutathione-disulfide reductase [Siculibacillus lacustris]